MKKIFGSNDNPLPWLDYMLNAVEHTNFFENRATEYARASTTGNWQDIFKQDSIMTDVQDKPTLTFNDKNYVIEDLSDEARYIVAQLQDLQAQESQTAARLDQIKVATDGFKTLLNAQLEKDENPEEEPTPEVVQ